MYRGLRWYMLTYGGGRDNDTCMITNNHKHVFEIEGYKMIPQGSSCSTKGV